MFGLFSTLGAAQKNGKEPNEPALDDTPMTGLQQFSMGADALSNLYNMWQGRQTYKLAKEQFRFNKGVTMTNMENQAKLTNERLATRQEGRNRYIAGSKPVGEFMQTYGVKDFKG